MVTSYPRRHLAIKLPPGKTAYKSGPEFPLFSQHVLVALDTGHGVIYAPASGWNRVYLMWTFRNFHSLPQTVLNPRQQQLIGSLYREAANYSAPELYEAPVVGTVEGFNPSSLSALPSSSKARKLDPVGSAQAPALDQGQPFHARFALNRMTLRVGAAALVAIIAILAWRELGAQPISDSELERIPAPARRSDDPIVIAKDLSPATGPLSDSVALPPSPAPIANPSPITESPASAIATTETTTQPSANTSSVSGKREAARHVASVQLPVAAAPGLYEAAADQPRLHISGRPRKLVYPVCPRTDARGKVSLQAVVSDDGAVDRVRVLTGDRVLAAAAIEAVRQWRYEPFFRGCPGRGTRNRYHGFFHFRPGRGRELPRLPRRFPASVLSQKYVEYRNGSGAGRIG